MTTTPPPPEPTDDEIRVRIAEAVGWKKAAPPFWVSPDDQLWNGIPNYLTDLNACAEFERTLKGTPKLARYVTKLQVICGDDYYEHKTHWTNHIAFASSHQRCLAFLATINGEKE